MKIAIVSDIHDQIDHLTWFLDEIKKYDISYIFALGDYCSPYIIERLITAPIPIFGIWGNNDGDKQTMFLASQKNPQCTFASREFGEIILEENRYFLSHYKELAENAAKSHDYDAVFHGHTHIMCNEKIGTVPMINPGKLTLYPNNIISFAIFDTLTQATEMIIKN